MRLKYFAMTALVILAALLLEGCGVVATPRPPARPTQEPFTLAPRTTAQATGESSGVQPSEQPAQPATADPTETPTTVPATATLAPTFTRTPTPAATEEVEAVPAATEEVEAVPAATEEVEAVPAATEEVAVAPAAGDAVLGEQLFASGAEGAAACSSCHSASDPNLIIVGPPLADIASVAGERMPGQSTEEYIHTSIVDPNAYLVPAPEGRVFTAGDMSLMPQNYGEVFSEEEISALVAYLMTLE